jgi:hypothetical protein
MPRSYFRNEPGFLTPMQLTRILAFCMPQAPLQLNDLWLTKNLWVGVWLQSPGASVSKWENHCPWFFCTNLSFSWSVHRKRENSERSSMASHDFFIFPLWGKHLQTVCFSENVVYLYHDNIIPFFLCTQNYSMVNCFPTLSLHSFLLCTCQWLLNTPFPKPSLLKSLKLSVDFSHLCLGTFIFKMKIIIVWMSYGYYEIKWLIDLK